MPYALAMFFQRSPNLPDTRQIAFFPGGTLLTSAASSAPVPEHVSGMMRFFVQKMVCKSCSTSAKSWRNSGVRWKNTGLAISRSVSSGTGVGPGVSRRCFTGILAFLSRQSVFIHCKDRAAARRVRRNRAALERSELELNLELAYLTFQ